MEAVNWRWLTVPFVLGVVWAALGIWTLADGESAVMPLAFGAFWLLAALLEPSTGSRRRQEAGGERP